MLFRSSRQRASLLCWRSAVEQLVAAPSTGVEVGLEERTADYDLYRVEQRS